MYKSKYFKLSHITKAILLLGLADSAWAIGNQSGINTHENGVAWGANSVNQLSHGVASGQGATVTKGNLTREQYQEGVRQYQSLLDEKNQLTVQREQLKGNKELKSGEIDILNSRINELNTKIAEHGNKLGQINSLNSQKQTMVDFVNNINSQITAKEGEYNLSDKTRIYEFEDFYKTLNKLDWSQYAQENGADNLANQLKARVSEFNPNIANKYDQEKYKEIISAYVNLNSIDKQPTANWFNEKLTTNNSLLDPSNTNGFNRNNEITLNGSDYNFFDFKYKEIENNNNKNHISKEQDGKITKPYISRYSFGNRVTLYNYNNNYYFNKDYNLRYNDNEENVLKDQSESDVRLYKEKFYLNQNNANDNSVWRYSGTNPSKEYLDEMERLYNGLDNTPNYSLYVTRNTLRAALNKEAPNLKLKNVEQNELYGVDYLTTLYANFGDINLVESLQKVINFDNEATFKESKNNFHTTIKLDGVNNNTINKANELANRFIRDYEGVDLNATAKNVASIEETRNLFKPFYDKMVQLRDITNLYKEINSGTLDESTKQQKQAVYLQKLADYRNALNAEIDHYDTLEGYIAHFVRPHVRYSNEFVNHFKTTTREYIDFLKTNRHKLLNYNPNDTLIKEISDKAKSLIQDLKNLNDQKSAKEKEIEGISNQIKNLTDNLGADEQALDRQKQEKQAELEKVQKEKEQLDAQVAEKEKELARKQAEVLEKLKQQSGEGNAVAIGDNSFASGVSAVALGVGSESIGDHALALGTQAKATKSDSIAIGHGTEVTGEKSIAIGKGHRVSGNRSTTIGDPNTITGDDSVAVGNNNTINSNHVMVLGNNVTVGDSLHHSVVLGSNSTVLAPVATTSHTMAGTQYNFAGTAPVATVSIGAEGKERTLTNLAAGRISNTSTDGINGSQLNAVIETLNSLNTELTTLKNAPKPKALVIKAGDGLSLTEGEDGSITLSNALTFNSGNGINVNKEGNNITITNTQPLSAEDKTKYDTASTNANNALEKANTNEGAINTANSKINDLTSRVTANEGNITTLTGKVTTVTNTANEALDKANTAVQPDALEAGNGISINKADGKITITNTQPLSDENKTKYDDASTKANTAVQPDKLKAGDGISVSKAENGEITITNTKKFEDVDKEKLNTASTNATSALEKANANEGSIGTANGKINDLTSRVTANEGNITTLTGKVTTVTNTANEALGKANTAVQPDALEAGNGIRLDKADGKITIVNTKAFEDADKEKLNTASTNANSALEKANTNAETINTVSGVANEALSKANTAVQPDKLKAGDGISLSKADNGEITITNTKSFEDTDKEKLNIASNKASTALQPDSLTAGNGVAIKNEGGKVTITNTGVIELKAGNGISVTNGDNGVVTVTNTKAFEDGDKEKLDVASGKANTAVQPDKLKAGNGISINKSENGDITVTNTHPLSDENKTKYDNASTIADNALEKANNALPKDGLISGEGISIQPKGDKLEISSTVKGGNGNENAPLPLKAGAGISIQDKEGRSEISTNLNGSGIEITQNEDGSVTLTNNIEAGSGVELERDGNKIIIKSKPIKQKLIDDAGRTLEKDSIKVTGGKNVTTVVKNGDFSVGLNDDIDVKSVTSDDIAVKNKVSVGDNELSKDGLKVATVRINTNGISAGGKVINDVKEGEVSETSQQAINGSQLHQTHQMINQVAMGVGENRQMIQAVNQRVDGLAQHVEKTSKSLRAGVAGSVATASLPQVYASGKSMVSAATGHYKNQNAIAIGYSKASDNGKLVFKVNASANTSKDVTVGTGIGYQW